MEIREYPYIQILKEEYSREKRKPVHGLEGQGGKNMSEKFKQHQGSQYSQRGGSSREEAEFNIREVRLKGQKRSMQTLLTVVRTLACTLSKIKSFTGY